MVRVLSASMAAVFAVATAIQHNDPDPLRWMIVYGFACAVSIWAAVRRSVPVRVASAAGLITLAVGVWLAAGVFGRVMPSELFEAWR